MSNYLYITYFVVFLQLIGLTIAVIVDPYIIKKHRIVILINCALTLILIAQNYLDCTFSLDDTKVFPRLIVSILGYAIRPLILIMWLYLIRRDQKLIVAWILVILNAIVHMTAFFSGVCFTISSDNSFVRGPLGYTCHVISAVLLLYLYWLSADMYIENVNDQIDEGAAKAASGISSTTSNNQMKQDFMRYSYGLGALVPTVCVLIIVISVVMDSRIGGMYQPIAFLTIAITSCNLFYYIWLHFGFARKHGGKLKVS